MNILSFDTETTSAEPKTCGVCQAAAIMFRETGLEFTPLEATIIMDEICDPGVDSCDGATEIHGITPAMWAGKRRDHEAMAELYAWMERNYLIDGEPQFAIAGHNCRWFDIPIWLRLAERPALFGLPVIDTLTCAQRLYPLAPSHRLTTNAKEPEKTGLIEWLQLGTVEAAHTAAGDAYMVYRLVRHFCDGLNKTPLELAAWCSEARLLRYCAFGKHKGKLWGTAEGCVPKGYAWYIAQNFDPTPDLEVTIKHHYGLRFKKKSR